MYVGLFYLYLILFLGYKNYFILNK